MKRGDVVVVVLKGDFGKPRPCLVVQADAYGGHTSVTIATMSSHLDPLMDVRIGIEPSSENGLLLPTQIQCDRLQTVRHEDVRGVIGALTATEMTLVDRGLALFLGIA